MNRIQEKIKQATKTMVREMVMQEPRTWPPTCLMFAYQPVRPEIQEENSAATCEE